MLLRGRGILTVTLSLVACGSGRPAADPASASTPHGASESATAATAASSLPGLEDLQLIDTSIGRTVSLSELRGERGTILFFSGLSCPVALGYEANLAHWSADLEAKGIAYLNVNANYQESIERVAAHAKAIPLPHPIYKDIDGRLSRAVGASRQSEVVLLDVRGRVVYQGRVDDRLAIGIKRPSNKTRELLDAVDALVAGKALTTAKTDASGCGIARRGQAATTGALTYTKDIAPIINKNCIDCHRPKGIGPMSLVSYDDVVAWADTVGEVIKERQMPPWERGAPDPQYGRFLNPRGLSEADRETLLKWVAAGAPRGEGPEPTATPRGSESNWTLGEPDLIVGMDKPYPVPARGPKDGIPYQRFLVYENKGAERWVQSVEFRPGVRSVVHHAMLMVKAPGYTEGLAGYTPSGDRFASWAPGRGALSMRPGFARRLPPGARLTLVVHYVTDGVARSDLTQVGVRFAPTPKREVHTLPIGDWRFEIPANDPNYPFVASYTLPDNTLIYSVGPHMHWRGKDFKLEAVSPKGKATTLIFVPHYDFNWQHTYEFVEPLRLPKGTVLRETVHFDNSKDNPANPDPTKVVRYGEQTWDEMMIGWVDLAYDVDARSPKLAKLLAIEHETSPFRGFAEFLIARSKAVRVVPSVPEE